MSNPTLADDSNARQNGHAEDSDITTISAVPEFDYPEGGLKGWLCVFGSFMGLLASLGILNSIGTFQTYLETHQLQGYNSGSIGWIFSLYTFLSFFCGIQIGPIFDARGPKTLLLCGSILITGMLISLGFCSKYWHFMLSFSVAGGIGTSLVFTPCIAAVGHFFCKKRGITTGIAAAGGALGGVIIPLALDSLFSRGVSWAWATRVVALMCLTSLAIAYLLVASRLPPKQLSTETILPDIRIFKDLKFSLATAAVFFVEWGIFIPITYISSYAISQGISTQLSYQLLAILNAGSIFGRWLPGYFADKFGRFNTLIVTVAMCLICIAALWLPAKDNTAMVITFSFLFGFASGSGISLTPVCIGQLCPIEKYGTYYASAYTIVSFSALTGVPIAGEIISRCEGQYWGLIVFTICCYSVGLVCSILVKLSQSGWNQPWSIY